MTKAETNEATSAERRLRKHRREVELRLADVRRAVDRELGFDLKRAGWITGVVAFSVGLLTAGRLVRRRREKKRLSRAEDVSSSSDA